jgi:hypothetical protein
MAEDVSKYAPIAVTISAIALVARQIIIMIQHVWVKRIELDGKKKNGVLNKKNHAEKPQTLSKPDFVSLILEATALAMLIVYALIIVLASDKEPLTAGTAATLLFLSTMYLTLSFKNSKS